MGGLRENVEAVAASVTTPLRWVMERWGGGYILAYHRITPERLQEHVAALLPDQPVTLTELVTRHREGLSTRGLFVITVDDGEGETTRELAKMAGKQALPVTFYLPVGYLDGDLPTFLYYDRLEAALPATGFRWGNRHVDLGDVEERQQFFSSLLNRLYAHPDAESRRVFEELWDMARASSEVDQRVLLDFPRPIPWEEVASLARNPLLGFESHGMSHGPVSASADDALRGELRESKRRLEEVTGHEVRHYCYPYGGLKSIGARAPRLVAETYASATTMLRGRIQNANPTFLPRVPIYQQDDGARVRLKTWVP